MRLLTLMLGSIAGIGLIGIIVIFQPEIRRFLLMIGNNTMHGRFAFIEKYFSLSGIKESSLAKEVAENIIPAVKNLSAHNTGALVVLTRSEIPAISNTGHLIDARINPLLLENLFFKNSPLHDGAVVIHNARLIAASCILPVSSNNNLPSDLGLRHRAALGAVEGTDLLSIIVSEENGEISYASESKLYNNVSLDELKLKIQQFFNHSD